MALRAFNLLTLLVVGTVGGVGVFMMTADPHAKMPAMVIFIALTAALGIQAIIK